MSKNVEDQLIGKLLYKLKIDKNFYLIECGALDGISGSATYYLSKFGYKTINIEPNPHAFKKLLMYRKNDINLNFALGEKNIKSKLTLPINGPLGLMPARSSLNLDKKYWLEQEQRESIEVDIEIITYKELIELNFNKKDKVGLFILDVEGYEIEVINGMKNSDYLPDYFFIETDKISSKIIEKKLSFLGNYRKILSIKGNTLYKLNGLSILNSIMLNLYKYYLIFFEKLRSLWNFFKSKS